MIARRCDVLVDKSPHALRRWDSIFFVHTLGLCRGIHAGAKVDASQPTQLTNIEAFKSE